MTQYLLFTKRTLALISVVVCAYIVAGCFMYGAWWYSWLWEAQFRDIQYTLEGLKTLLDDAFIMVVIVLFAFLVAAVLGNYFRVYLFRILDRTAWHIILASAWLTFVTFLFVYHRYHSKGPGIFTRIGEITAQTSRQLRIMNSLPALQTPIDFHYVDNTRVEALYSQIAPELVESQRTVADSRNNRAKVGIDVRGLNAEGGIDRGSASTSSFSRAGFTVERKCVLVMQYVIENERARYYTTAENWMAVAHYGDSILKDEQSSLDQLLHDIRFNVPLVAPTAEKQTPTEAVKREADERNRKQKLDEDSLQYELQNLQGLIFLDDTFEAVGRGENATLITEFEQHPRRVHFRVSIPNQVVSRISPKAKLRVFGDVIGPLSSNGDVDIRAIAVY